jgi:alkylation response protein AidB-like acyl-CoA dehydrogenase
MSFNMSFNEEQIALQKMLRKFVDNEMSPVRALYDETEEYPWPVVKKMQELGLNCIVAPEKYNGFAYDSVIQSMIAEELCRGCTGIALAVLTNCLASEPVLIGGNDEQKDWWFTRLCEAGKMASFAVTEPGAGSNVAGIATTARKDGDDYILNGTKCFITNGGVASQFTVLASLDRNQGHKAMAFFIVDSELEGLAIGKKEKKMGIRASNTVEVVLDNVRVNKKWMLGKEGDGFKIAMKTFDASRPLVGALAVGCAQGAFEFARDYAKERITFGKPIASYQAIQFMLADMAMKIEASRLLVQKAAWLLDQGLPNTTEASFAKCFGADTAMEVTTNAVQILGGYGYSREYPVEKMMRDAKILQIFEGTAQIQRIVIAANLLG